MSPEVWDDAEARIRTAAAAIPIEVRWPNLGVQQQPAVIPGTGAVRPFLEIEAAAEGSDEIEIGGSYWDERGTIYLHVMIPVGTGIRAGLATRMTLSNAFLAVTDAPEGLSYRNGRDFDVLGPSEDDGAYRRLTVAVRYHYQTRIV